MKTDTPQQVYSPKEYEAYIDTLCLKLITDLKNGVINENVFAQTYAKYQKLKVNNAKSYASLSQEMKKFVDSYSESILASKKDGITIANLQIKLKTLQSENEDLKKQVAELQLALSQKYCKNSFDPIPSNPFDPINPWPITCFLKNE